MLQFKQISDNEIYLLIKYIKSIFWRGAKRLSYIEDAQCLEVKLMWSRKQQIPNCRNLKTGCINKRPAGNTNIAFTSYQQVAARRVLILATSTLRLGMQQFPKHWFYSIIDGSGSQKKKVKTIYHNRIATLIKDSNIAVTVPHSRTPRVHSQSL